MADLFASIKEAGILPVGACILAIAIFVVGLKGGGGKGGSDSQSGTGGGTS